MKLTILSFGWIFIHYPISFQHDLSWEYRHPSCVIVQPLYVNNQISINVTSIVKIFLVLYTHTQTQENAIKILSYCILIILKYSENGKVNFFLRITIKIIMIFIAIIVKLLVLLHLVTISCKTCSTQHDINADKGSIVIWLLSINNIFSKIYV